MPRVLSALALLLTLVLAFGCETPEDELPTEEGPARVFGTVTYLQRVSLPPDAVVHVSLFDGARDSQSRNLVNEQTVAAEGELPYHFAVWYKPDTLDPHHTYTLEARIDAGGHTWFKNTNEVRVITHGAPSQIELVLQMVAP
jgi:putative lipoprotein